MKAKLYFMVIALLSALAITFAACSGGGDVNNGTAPKDAGQGTTEIQPPPGGALTWDDVPIYAAAEQIQKGNWSIPPAQGDFSKVEWRYYELDGANDVAMVTRFYKMEMPKNGWQETNWMEAGGMSWALYHKNGEENVAMIWIGTSEDKTIIAIMKGLK